MRCFTDLVGVYAEGTEPPLCAPWRALIEDHPHNAAKRSFPGVVPCGPRHAGWRSPPVFTPGIFGYARPAPEWSDHEHGGQRPRLTRLNGTRSSGAAVSGSRPPGV